MLRYLFLAKSKKKSIRSTQVMVGLPITTRKRPQLKPLLIHLIIKVLGQLKCWFVYLILLGTDHNLSPSLFT